MDEQSVDGTVGDTDSVFVASHGQYMSIYRITVRTGEKKAR
jgi:hypothetical protein